MTYLDLAWMNEQAQRVSALHSKRDMSERLEFLATLPMHTHWVLVQQELNRAAEEIRTLRRRIEALESDGA